MLLAARPYDTRLTCYIVLHCNNSYDSLNVSSSVKSSDMRIRNFENSGRHGEPYKSIISIIIKFIISPDLISRLILIFRIKSNYLNHVV